MNGLWQLVKDLVVIAWEAVTRRRTEDDSS